MSLTIGQPAPDFTLFDTEKQEVSLSGFKGKNVVLLFFPQAFTGVCTEELCSTRDNIGVYEGLDAQVLAISVDSIFTLGKFKEDQQFNFPLLSDFNKEVSRKYGAIFEDWILNMKGVSKRSVFIIDKEGVLRYSEVLESAGDMPDFAKAQEALKSMG